jgi:hypothetical protein
MKLTNEQLAKIEKETDRAVDFCAQQVVEAIFETCSDDQLDNSQRIFDMVCDHLNGKDMTKMVIEKLRKNMKVQ